MSEDVFFPIHSICVCYMGLHSIMKLNTTLGKQFMSKQLLIVLSKARGYFIGAAEKKK